MKYLIGEIKHQFNLLFNSTNSEIEHELRKNGVVVLKNFITKKSCEKLVKQIDSSIESGNVSWTDKKKSDVRIFGFENLFPNSANLFKSIDYLYGSYIDNNKKSSVLMANKVNFVIDNLGSGGGWHRDSLNRRQLKFMIYLNRVNEENGPFEYLMGSHRLNSKLKTNHFLFKKTRYTSEDVKKYSRTWEPKKILGTNGTCVVFDSSGNLFSFRIS